MAKKKTRPRYKPKKSAPIVVVLDEPVPAKPAWKFDRMLAVECLGLLLLPLVAFWAMRFVPINQNLYLDPYVYTGYIHNFQDLIARYGLRYYSVRFGLIVPAQWFTQLFGPEGGYFALRYVLALIAAFPIYYMVKRNFSPPVAVLTVVGMVASPYFARALLWDHPDATGVPFLIAAVCLFLLDERASPWRDTLAGACAAMAVHSNFFVISLVGIFGVVWLAFSLLFRHPLKDLLKHFAGVAIGAVLVTALGVLYYWHAYGKLTDIFSVTLGMAANLQGGGAKQWRTPGMIWIAAEIHVLIPIVLSVCCMLVIRWRRASATNLIIVGFGTAATAFYYVEQFLLSGDVLQLFYYFSYLVPAVFLMLATIWQMLWERIGRSAPVFIGLGLSVLLIPWLGASWGGWAVPNVTVPQWLTLAGVAAAGVVLGTREWRVPAMRVILPWVALVVLGCCFTAGLGFYSGMVRTGRAENRETDVYRVALQFMQVVPKVAEHPGVIRFWYNNRVGNSINSIQSTYLWGYSKLNTSPPEDPGLPHLGEFQLQLLRDPEVRYLALLGETEEELSEGLAALTQQAIAFKAADYRVLASGDYRIFFQLVELRRGPNAVTR